MSRIPVELHLVFAVATEADRCVFAAPYTKPQCVIEAPEEEEKESE